MKAIHNKPEKKGISLNQWLSETRELERKDREAAVKEYKQIVITYPTNENAYDRLMILFRLLKQSKNELYWIDKAISNFQARLKKPSVHANSKIAKLSKSIARAMDLLDKKDNPVYQPGPVSKWLKRKELLQKRM